MAAVANRRQYAAAPADVRGKARKKAELRKLTRESEMLQEELAALSNLPPASEACKELLRFFESCPDPFLDTWNHEERPNPWTQPVQNAQPKCCGIM